MDSTPAWPMIPADPPTLSSQVVVPPCAVRVHAWWERLLLACDEMGVFVDAGTRSQQVRARPASPASASPAEMATVRPRHGLTFLFPHASVASGTVCSRLVFVSVSQLVVNAGKLAERSILALSRDCHDLARVHPRRRRLGILYLNGIAAQASRQSTCRLAMPMPLKQQLQRGM